MPSTEYAIIITGGTPASAEMLAGLPEGALCIAADSGFDHALEVGLHPTVLVGDNDSISAAGLTRAHTDGVEIVSFPADKDFTDTELALNLAIQRGATHLTLLSGGGDRLDHTIGAIAALGHPSLASCASLTARWANNLIHVVHGPGSLELTLPYDTTVSIMTLHGACTGVTVVGARWLLTGAELPPGTSRALSNTTVDPVMTVSATAGVLTVIVPNYFGDRP